MYKNLSLEDLSGEVWKDIPDYEGKYQVSNLGRVKTLIDKRIDKRGWSYKMTPKIMKQCFTTTGYLSVTLLHKTYKVHRLVAMAFIENKDNKPYINHKDFNTLNNKVENLEWCSQKENVEHSVLNQRNKKYNYFDIELAIHLFKNGFAVKEIAKKLNVPEYSIRNRLAHKKIKRSRSDTIGIYNISPNEIRKYIKLGMSNKVISEKFNVNSNYISVLRYKMKLKGEI